MKLKLVLANGMEFPGEGVGSEKIGRVVYNTSMVGYQQIIYDKANYDDIVVMTYTLIGNYGINDEDYESDKAQIKAMVAKEFNHNPSNFRSNKSIIDLFAEQNVTYLEDLDTREISKVIRDQGEMLGIITSIETSKEEALAKIKAYKKDEIDLKINKYSLKNDKAKFKLACIDLGAKKSIFNVMSNYYDVEVFPYDVKAKDLKDFDGIFLAGGPKIVSVDLVKELIGKKPILAQGIGCNVVAEAYGAKNKLMATGHRGGNHNVKYTKTFKNFVIAQNHDYVITDTLNKFDILCKNLLDDTIEGIINEKDLVLALQYNLDNEASPEDFNNIINMFNEFLNKGGKKNA